ncbi:MAG: integration host factor subunit beta [Treponema sp.]|nr:integration host factor subunit beta [Treponema sp.]
MAEKKYTKAELIDEVYGRTGINRKDIRVVLDLLVGGIKDALVKEAVVELRGFGTFETRIRKGRSKARNPRTGESASSPSHGIAAFRPGRELKQAVWNLPSLSE